jgi:hypothetical protein
MKIDKFEFVNYSCRPTDMYCVNDMYYPEGVPTDNSPIVDYNKHTDKNGKEFKIVYTETQFKQHLKKNFGIFFPFLPLFVSSCIEK